MMTRTDRFGNLDAVRTELLRLEAARDRHAAKLESHVEVLKQREFRGLLLKNSISGLLSGSLPGKLLGSVLGNGGIGNGIGMALGAGKGGLVKRIGLFALGMAAPKLLEKLEKTSFPNIGHELMVSLQRLKDFWEQRRSEKSNL